MMNPMMGGMMGGGMMGGGMMGQMAMMGQMGMGMGKGNKMMGGGMMGGGMMGAGGAGSKGEIRYDNPMCAQQALAGLQGTELNGAQITIGQDVTSKDGTKLWVTGIAPGTSWQELKDHFAQAGQVAFANVK